MLKNKKGQSTLEYIILVTAVIAILLVFLGPSGVFRKAYNSTLGDVTSVMNKMSNRYTNSIPNQ